MSEPVHIGFSCNACYSKIAGFRYKCLDCRDFDFCSMCKIKNHPDHVFIRFFNPITSLDIMFLEKIMAARRRKIEIEGSHSVRCNRCHAIVCKEFIYKCVDCPHINLCGQCENLKDQCIGGSTHILVRFANPLSKNLDLKAYWLKILSIRNMLYSHKRIEGASIHIDVKCNNCSDEIVGLRLTCVECNDFDLCSLCESQMVHREHWMVRLRGPNEPDTKSLLLQIRKIKSSFTECVPGVSCSAYGTHVGIHCDLCATLIAGFRYKCLECPDYDLCTNCLQKGNHLHHLMIRISKDNPGIQNILKKIKQITIRNYTLPSSVASACRDNAQHKENVSINVTRGTYSQIGPSSSLLTGNSSGEHMLKLNETPRNLISMCCICHENLVDVIILNCGHICICSQCEETVSQTTKCPICRGKIERMLKAYF